MEDIFHSASKTSYKVLGQRLDSLRSLVGKKIGGASVLDFRYRPRTDEVIIHLMRDKIPGYFRAKMGPRVISNPKVLEEVVSRYLSA